MVIRRYKSLDCKVLAELFYNTVHIVNAKDYTKDYTKEQLDVWQQEQLIKKVESIIAVQTKKSL